MAVATTPPAVSSLSTKTVFSISAKEFHEVLLRSQASGNIARRRFVDALRALAERRLYLELGELSWSLVVDLTRVATSDTCGRHSRGPARCLKSKPCE